MQFAVRSAAEFVRRRGLARQLGKLGRLGGDMVRADSYAVTGNKGVSIMMRLEPLKESRSTLHADSKPTERSS